MVKKLQTLPLGFRKMVFVVAVALLMACTGAKGHVLAQGSVHSVSGNIDEDTVWTTGNVYVVTGDMNVVDGVTLTIQPGVVVKIDGRRKIGVNGTLNACGTAENKIYITDYRDDVGGDTNEDGDVSSPEPGGWSRITFSTGSTGVLDHCVIRYGGGTWGGWGTYKTPVMVSKAQSVTIQNSEFSHNRLYGIQLREASGIVSLTNNLFSS